MLYRFSMCRLLSFVYCSRLFLEIRGDADRFSSAYLAAVGVIAFITFPLMAGLFAVADDFVVVVLGINGSEWSFVLKIFAWLGMMQSIATTVGTIYLATGGNQTDVRFQRTVRQC